MTIATNDVSTLVAKPMFSTVLPMPLMATSTETFPISVESVATAFGTQTQQAPARTTTAASEGTGITLSSLSPSPGTTSFASTTSPTSSSIRSTSTSIITAASPPLSPEAAVVALEPPAWFAKASQERSMNFNAYRRIRPDINADALPDALQPFLPSCFLLSSNSATSSSTSTLAATSTPVIAPQALAMGTDGPGGGCRITSSGSTDEEDAIAVALCERIAGCAGVVCGVDLYPNERGVRTNRSACSLYPDPLQVVGADTGARALSGYIKQDRNDSFRRQLLQILPSSIAISFLPSTLPAGASTLAPSTLQDNANPSSTPSSPSVPKSVAGDSPSSGTPVPATTIALIAALGTAAILVAVAGTLCFRRVASRRQQQRALEADLLDGTARARGKTPKDVEARFWERWWGNAGFEEGGKKAGEFGVARRRTKAMGGLSNNEKLMLRRASVVAAAAARVEAATAAAAELDSSEEVVEERRRRRVARNGVVKVVRFRVDGEEEEEETPAVDVGGVEEVDAAAPAELVALPSVVEGLARDDGEPDPQPTRSGDDGVESGQVTTVAAAPRADQVDPPVVPVADAKETVSAV
ncbi:hypothetical protein HDU96_000958 [Phlyctochytrium bullatum]|nr:hypothetical protein HDU96_000958 [Phlyctochytrium bullatum]